MAEGKAHAQGEVHVHSALPYVLTYVALFILTITTFLLAEVRMGEWSFVVAMLIAFTKGMLVVLFFMHLADQKGASRLTLGIAILFVLLLITLSCADVSTRFPLALPPGSDRALHALTGH
jgi:cytochrome c oxidase subunit 4